MVVDKLNQFSAHAHRTLLSTQQDVGIALHIMNLQVELSLTLIVLYHRLQVVHQGLVYHIAIHNNGESLQSVFLHGLQIFHCADFEVQIVAVAITGHTFCRAVDGTSFHHNASPCTPILTKERQFARAFEILYGNEATRLARLGKLRLHLGDDAAKHHIFLLG